MQYKLNFKIGENIIYLYNTVIKLFLGNNNL